MKSFIKVKEILIIFTLLISTSIVANEANYQKAVKGDTIVYTVKEEKTKEFGEIVFGDVLTIINNEVYKKTKSLLNKSFLDVNTIRPDNLNGYSEIIIEITSRTSRDYHRVNASYRILIYPPKNGYFIAKVQDIDIKVD